jgi:hypothetical protein
MTRDRALRILARSPKDPAITIKIVLSERPMRAAMVRCSMNILGVSIVI